MNKSFFLHICFWVLFPLCSTAQSDIDAKVSEGASFICSCTKASLVKNGIDVVKLVEIYNSYKPTGILLARHKSDVKKINNQLDSNYSLISNDIFECRNRFKQKYKSYFNNRAFLEKLEIKLNNNPYSNGPKTIKDLASAL